MLLPRLFELASVYKTCYKISVIPAYLKKYFWEVDTRKLDPQKRPEYIVARILEFGDPSAIKWIWRSFSKKEWRAALKLREVSGKTRNFWSPLLSRKK